MIAEPSSPILGAAGLDVGYHGTPVVHGAAIQLHAGRVTALLGPNGSGKSTLLRALARLHRPTAGEVQLEDGTDAYALSAKEFAKRVTLLAQTRPTPSGISVADVVGYGRYPYRGRWRADDPDGPRAVTHALAITGLTGMRERAADELSGGELQRVWLATCLAQDTSVLLLDEPTTFLDLRYQVEILDLIRELADEHQVAVGVVLHELGHAAAIADDVVLLDTGRVRATGGVHEVLTPRNLTEVYGIEIEVDEDPSSGLPAPKPVGRHTRRARAPMTNAS